MIYNQLYSVVNTLSKQAFGESAPVATNFTGLVSMGDYVMNSETHTDAFLKAMPDVFGKAIFENRAFTANTRGLYRNEFEFGSALIDTTVRTMAAEKNDTYDVENGTKFEAVIKKPEILIKIFSNRGVWQDYITIPTRQMKSAFKDELQMTQFISGFYTALQNSMEIQKQTLTTMTECNFIARKTAFVAEHPGEGVHVVDLLKEANDFNGLVGEARMTEPSCFKDERYTSYATKRIWQIKNQLKGINKIFNCDKIERQVPEDDICLHLHEHFVQSAQIFYRSNVYNEKLAKLPGYEEIDFWQALGNGDPKDTMKIDITTSDGKVAKLDSVVGLIFDRRAMGFLFDDLHSTSFWDAQHEVTDVWYKAEKGMFNNMSYDGVVFINKDA